MATTALAALLATMGGATAGGFAIREQSAEYQGMSFAGNAAGGSLSAMFWNPAATASLAGFNTESSMSGIFADSKVTTTSSPYGTDPTKSGDIGPPAFVPASYGSYQLTRDIYIGMGINAPFGLESNPTNSTYNGAVLAQKTELVTYNFNPTVAIRIAPGFTVGAGVQIESAEGRFSFASGSPTAPTTTVEGNGWGFGGTAGVMIEATPTTRIGIGYRSQIDQDIDGHITLPTSVGTYVTPTQTTLKLPDVVTVSVSQILSPVLRLNGTFEWTNWSRFKDLSVSGTGVALSLPFEWSDGYFISAGAEYDIFPYLTGRFGVAYEWSPVDSPEMRSPGIPDNNRVWLSGGFSWQFTQSTTIDFAYTHLFVDDSTFVRPIPGAPSGFNVAGDVESKLDIVSVGVKTHW